MIDIMRQDGRFTPPTLFTHTIDLVQGYIGMGVKMGEGWLLTAEMLELADKGVENIVCTQPFGCLPNHICGKGMMKPIKAKNPNINIVAIDYDAGATKVNQENRLKLMLANARERRPAPAEQRPRRGAPSGEKAGAGGGPLIARRISETKKYPAASRRGVFLLRCARSLTAPCRCRRRGRAMPSHPPGAAAPPAQRRHPPPPGSEGGGVPVSGWGAGGSWGSGSSTPGGRITSLPKVK